MSFGPAKSNSKFSERRRSARKPAARLIEYELIQDPPALPGTWMNGVTGQLWLTLELLNPLNVG